MRAWVRGLALAAIVVATATAPASASPRDDLASVEPAARDDAAATLRQRYRPTARGIMARAVRPARPGLTVAAALHLVLGTRGAGWASADMPATLVGLVPDVAERDVYVCGPTQWADAIEREARAAGVRRESIHREAFAWSGDR